MITKTKAFRALFAFVLTVSCVLIASLSFGQEMPKPGTVINASNYKQYADLFPKQFLPAFTNGFGGFLNPISITVSKPDPCPIPPAYQKLSERNKGKVTLGPQGSLLGYKYVGLPFPDLKRSDPNFATKLMWNYEYRYQLDDQLQNCCSYEKRRGQAITTSRVTISFLYAINRLAEDPKPTMPTPSGLAHAMLLHFHSPESMRDTMTLSYRYMDPAKPDDTYLYLPSMRRVLRGEAGERSTPVLGSVQALDDFNGFDGKTQDFTYKLVGEKKVLVVANSIMDLNYAKKFNGGYLPFPDKKWEVRDCYIIDITAKDPKYPQGRKRIYLDAENGSYIYYTIVWDRAGKLWKMWVDNYRRFGLPGGQFAQAYNGNFGIDFQFGLANYVACNEKDNGNHFTYDQFTPSSLLMRAR